MEASVCRRFVAKEMLCSPSSVWAAWRDFGPVLLATDFLRERYDIDALSDSLMTAARDGRKFSDEEMSRRFFERLAQEILEIQTDAAYELCEQVARPRISPCDRSLQKSPLLIAADRIGRSKSVLLNRSPVQHTGDSN